MKTNFANIQRLSPALLAALLLGTSAVSSQAALALPPSPVFTNGVPAWDCLISGANGEQGIMFLNFTTNHDGYGNYSFDLQMIHTKVTASTTSGSGSGGPVDPRSSSTPARGDGLSNLSGAPASGTATNIYGYWATTGSWGFDYKGNILGFYVELLIDKPGEGTNPPTVLTNAVSFIAKATPNKRLTALYSSSIGGNGKYSGVPLKTVTNQINGSDFSGSWTGNEIIGSSDAVELFTMSSAGFPNSYKIIGDGPGYSLDWRSFGVGPFSSKCLVSSQKKIAFSNHKFNNETNSTYYQRATIGPLINSTSVVGSKTKGLLQGGISPSSGSNTLYNAYFVPFVPYP